MNIINLNIKTNWLENPVFIIGYPKSGTSLLNAILDNHPQLVVLSEESNFIITTYLICEKLQRKSKLEKRHIDAIIVSLEKSRLRLLGQGKVSQEIGGNFDYSDFDYDGFIAYIRKQLKLTEITPSGVFKLVMQSFYIHSGLKYNNVKYWVEKTPYNKTYLENRKRTYEKMFGQKYKVIHIIRDPRDNYIAYKKKYPSLSVAEFVMGWRRVIKMIQEYDKNHFLVRYEDLVKEPEKNIDRIVDFLAIDSNDTLLKPSKYGVEWFGNSMFKNKSSGITAKNTARYKKYPDKKSIHLIEYLLSDEMIKYKYIFGRIDLSLLDKCIAISSEFLMYIRYKIRFCVLSVQRLGFLWFWPIKEHN